MHYTRRTIWTQPYELLRQSKLTTMWHTLEPPSHDQRLMELRPLNAYGPPSSDENGKFVSP
jgi:hypothetical protein